MNLFLKVKEMFKNLLLLILLIFLYSCQSVKDALSGKKYESSDEFLVIKKNPLEIPPNFDELPVPQTEKINDQSELVDEEIKDLIKSINSKNVKSNEAGNRSAEEFVIDQINKD